MPVAHTPGLKVVEFFLEQKLILLSNLTHLAAQVGALEVLKWSVRQNAFGTDPTERTLECSSLVDSERYSCHSNGNSVCWNKRIN
jgi:hypothetical protein